MGSIKDLPYWRGIQGIRFWWQGSQSDPLLVFRRYVFTCEDIESALWGEFLEETGHTDSESGNCQVEKEFTDWLKDGDRAKNYLCDCIHGKCYIRRV